LSSWRRSDEVAAAAGEGVLVIGGNFGGLTAALILKHEVR
jgi:heterodisulfide reductase subunit A-like polyferredoxin